MTMMMRVQATFCVKRTPKLAWKCSCPQRSLTQAAGQRVHQIQHVGTPQNKVDEDTKWKTRILRQILRQVQVQLIQWVWAESSVPVHYTGISSVLARLSAHTDWISCMYLAQYPRLQFCGNIYIHRTVFIYGVLKVSNTQGRKNMFRKKRLLDQKTTNQRKEY